VFGMAVKQRRSRLTEDAVREDEAERELVRLHRRRRRLDLEAARLLARIDRSSHYVFGACSSIQHYGERHGYSAREARILAAVGHTLSIRPAWAERILMGKLSLDAAAALGLLLKKNRMREDDDWLTWAEQWSARELERGSGPMRNATPAPP